MSPLLFLGALPLLLLRDRDSLVLRLNMAKPDHSLFAARERAGLNTRDGMLGWSRYYFR